MMTETVAMKKIMFEEEDPWWFSFCYGVGVE
jgi:hypothetical protein